MTCVRNRTHMLDDSGSSHETDQVCMEPSTSDHSPEAKQAYHDWQKLDEKLTIALDAHHDIVRSDRILAHKVPALMQLYLDLLKEVVKTDSFGKLPPGILEINAETLQELSCDIMRAIRPPWNPPSPTLRLPEDFE